jgi:hypothetical protein
MATKRLTPEQIQEARDLVAKHGGLSQAAKATGISRTTLQSRIQCEVDTLVKSVRSTVVDMPVEQKISDLELLRQDVKMLKRRLAAAEEDQLTTEMVRRTIFQIADTIPNPPQWVLEAPSKKSISGVPTLFASDWHWGEVVKPAQVEGVNEYTLAIAQARCRTLIEVAIDLLKNHVVNPSFPGIVFALGGDMISGDIHEELTETNEVPVLVAVLDIVDHLIAAITSLADQFGNVFLPCVTGNHGRNTKKPRAKNRVFSNFDWLIYMQLQRHFKDDPRITFFIPDSSDAYFRIYNHRYLLTHGDQFRGGDGMIGALGPIIRGDKKKRGRNAQIDRPYDTMMLGHWHQLIQKRRVIVNGSLKGYDEYAYASNFDVEPAQQGLWLTHPQHGITISMPVVVQRESTLSSAPWVSIPSSSA